jgi:hypothetical protein
VVVRLCASVWARTEVNWVVFCCVRAKQGAGAANLKTCDWSIEERWSRETMWAGSGPSCG